jgi:hypothetical protein
MKYQDVRGMAAKEWGRTVRGYVGKQGGWIYTSSDQTVTQGWGSIYHMFTREIRDHYTRMLTGFDSFDSMVNSSKHYRPTLLHRPGVAKDWRHKFLADEYDACQKMRKDPRRAYRGFSTELSMKDPRSRAPEFWGYK